MATWPGKAWMRWLWIFLGAGTYLVQQLLGRDSAAVEDLYSRGFFVGYRWVWDHTLGYSPVPLIYVLVAGVVAWIVIRILRHMAAKRTGTPILTKIGRAALSLGGVIGFLVFFFCLLWGFTYDRLSLGLQIGLEVVPVDLPTLRIESDRTERVLAG